MCECVSMCVSVRASMRGSVRACVCALLTYLVNALTHCCLRRSVVVGDWMIVNIHLLIITSVRCR